MLSRVRIHVALLLLALALLIGFVGLDVFFNWRHQDRKLLADSEATLRYEAFRLKSILDTELTANPQFAERMLMQRSTNPNLQLVAVVDDRGRILMSTRFGAKGQRAVDVIPELHDSDLQNALSASGPFMLATDEMHPAVLQSFGHIGGGDDVIGHNDGVIVLRTDLTQRRRALWREIAGETETKFALGMLFMLVLTGLLQIWIVGPIRALDSAADAIAAGRRDAKIPQGGLLELVRLSHAFSSMRDHLISALDELGVLNRGLESTVAERTEALRTALDRAEQTSSAKAAFLANMSHEIRTPMNAIIGLSQLTLALPLDADARNYTEKVLRSAEHLLGVINDILDFSRIEAGKIRLDRIGFSLADSLDKAMTFVAARARAKQLDLQLMTAPDVPDALTGDPLRLSQILTNLLGNAVKFTESGHVHLRVALAGEEKDQVRLRFEIEDTGIGIPREALVSLFQPFEQVDGSISRRYGGSGLGLAISRQLVDLMDGTIGVHSESGRGSLFHVELPFGLEVTAAETVPDHSKLRDSTRLTGGLGGQQVLVVSADPQRRKRLRAMLESQAATVNEADTESSALEGIETGQSLGAVYRFVLLDRRDDPGGHGRLLAELRRPRDPGGLRTLAVELIDRADPMKPDDRFDLRIVEPGSATALAAMLGGLALGETPTNMPAGERVAGPLLPRPPDLSGLRVLVAEDNEINQELAASLLRHTHAEVTIVDDGEQAVQAAAANPFDVVLMDIQMPRLNGIEATHRIRALPSLRQPMIVAVTANALSGDRERYLQSGMDHYLSKPVDAAELFGILASLRDSRGGSPEGGASMGTDIVEPCLAGLRAADVAVDVAIERLMGNRALYLKMAQRFACERYDWPEQFETALRSGAGGGAAALLHSAKSLAGMLGLSVLQEQMAQLEAIMATGEHDEIRAREVCRRFRESIALFRRILPPNGEEA